MRLDLDSPAFWIHQLGFKFNVHLTGVIFLIKMILETLQNIPYAVAKRYLLIIVIYLKLNYFEAYVNKISYNPVHVLSGI
jgi:hypothetical protein